MRRTSPARHVGALLLATTWVLLGAAQTDDCAYDTELDRLVCDISGPIPGDDRPSEEPADHPPSEEPDRQPPGAGPPLPFLYSTGDCFFSTILFAPDCDPDPEATPRCDPAITEPIPDRAWRVFRSFPLAVPAPSFQPPNHGITGLLTYLATSDPATITHSELLPDGRLFEVRALVASFTVDWGDGATTTEDPAVALPFPDGRVTHTYQTKTCPPEYRATHPSGQNCHPTLEAYPVTATFTWFGEYRVGGAWIPIGTLDLITTVLYDVDEVVGVLVDP